MSKVHEIIRNVCDPKHRKFKMDVGTIVSDIAKVDDPLVDASITAALCDVLETLDFKDAERFKRVCHTLWFEEGFMDLSAAIMSYYTVGHCCDDGWKSDLFWSGEVADSNYGLGKRIEKLPNQERKQLLLEVVRMGRCEPDENQQDWYVYALVNISGLVDWGEIEPLAYILDYDPIDALWPSVRAFNAWEALVQADFKLGTSPNKF